jgi:hypothetical protein
MDDGSDIVFISVGSKVVRYVGSEPLQLGDESVCGKL